MSSWYYREMGSRNKKTGKLNYYNVRVTEHKIDDCECMARQFRPYSPLKHMKRLHEKTFTPQYMKTYRYVENILSPDRQDYIEEY